MRMIKKYLKKDVYIQDKGKKLLIIWYLISQNNNGISENNEIVKRYPKSTNQVYEENWVEINDDSCWKYNTNSQFKFKSSMLRSSLCDYSDAYIRISETITITGE